MTRIILYTLIGFLVITFALMAISYDTFMSIIPGWHTTLINTQFITLAFFAWIAVVVILYFILFNKKIKLNKTLLFLHLAFTIPLIIMSIVLKTIRFDQNTNYHFNDVMQFLLLSIPLYLIGQLLFIYQLVMAYKKQKSQLD